MRLQHLIVIATGLALTACGGDVTGDDAPAEAVDQGPANQVLPLDPTDNGTTEGETPSEPAEAAPAAAAPRSASGYRLIGTEPFWGGTVAETSVLYSTPENQSGERIAVTRRIDGDREIYSGRKDGRPFVLTLSDGPCSDGMSDNVHQYTARLEVDGEVRSGCANPNA